MVDAEGPNDATTLHRRQPKSKATSALSGQSSVVGEAWPKDDASEERGDQGGLRRGLAVSTVWTTSHKSMFRIHFRAEGVRKWVTVTEDYVRVLLSEVLEFRVY
ncbi:hypothetical protein L5515_004558 [Caenorhabditis briggsae]|uniref:Uncharacterized protein n=1 Tax=Caenorhabditis briggsae TaxID=6238 RepID=A0AAE9EHZ8_CAEBR|nr:hypothetical protein L5515_004558 [Caenorhabditis briggsae]